MHQNMYHTPDLAAAKEGELVSRLVSEVGVAFSVRSWCPCTNRQDNPCLLRTPKVIRQAVNVCAGRHGIICKVYGVFGQG